MSTPAAKAAELIKQANKKASGGGGFFGMFSDPKQKMEEAASLFREAAIQFKIAKDFKGAAEANMQAAELYLKGDIPHEAATSYNDAATLYKKVSNDDAIRATVLAAETYSNMGRFVMSAKMYNAVGELYETQVVDLEQAVHYYAEAVSAYEMEDSDSSADKIKLKVAHIKAQQEKFDEAQQTYEEVATRMAENKLLKYGAKEYFLKASLCRLCLGDAIATKRAVENYCMALPQFQDSREHKLLLAIVDAVEEGDIEKYQQAVQEFDTIQKLDAWMTTVLLHIKKSMDGDDVL